MTFFDQVNDLFNVFLGRATEALDTFLMSTFELLLIVVNSVIRALGGPF